MNDKSWVVVMKNKFGLVAKLFKSIYWLKSSLYFFIVFSPLSLASDLICEGPRLTNDDVIEIVKRERASRKVIPPAFNEKVEIKIMEKRCHYVYVEYPASKTVGRNRVLVISRYGNIVDALSGRSANTFLDCPDIDYSLDDLERLVNKQRRQYDDLPVRPKNASTKMSKMRCMYVYYEMSDPEKSGDYQTFTLDYYGDIYEFYRSK